MMGLDASWIYAVPAGIFTLAGLLILASALRGAGRVPEVDQVRLQQAYDNIDRRRLANVLKERQAST